MPKYHLYPFFDDESATVFGTPIITVEADEPPTEIDRDLLVEILHSLGDDAEITADLTYYQQMADRVWDQHTLMLDQCAIVADDPKITSMLETVGSQLMQDCGSDSCWYKASAAFTTILKHVAITIIDFPVRGEDAG